MRILCQHTNCPKHHHTVEVADNATHCAYCGRPYPTVDLERVKEVAAKNRECLAARQNYAFKSLLWFMFLSGLGWVVATGIELRILGQPSLALAAIFTFTLWVVGIIIWGFRTLDVVWKKFPDHVS